MSSCWWLRLKSVAEMIAPQTGPERAGEPLEEEAAEERLFVERRHDAGEQDEQQQSAERVGEVADHRLRLGGHESVVDEVDDVDGDQTDRHDPEHRLGRPAKAPRPVA